jgi:hypothetical protein
MRIRLRELGLSKTQDAWRRHHQGHLLAEEGCQDWEERGRKDLERLIDSDLILDQIESSPVDSEMKI